jgi:acyl carrier protein
VTLEQLCALVALQLGRTAVDPDARLVEELAADSMDLVAMLALIEERSGVALDETVFADVATCRELHERVRAGGQPAGHGT